MYIHDTKGMKTYEMMPQLINELVYAIIQDIGNMNDDGFIDELRKYVGLSEIGGKTDRVDPFIEVLQKLNGMATDEWTQFMRQLEKKNSKGLSRPVTHSSLKKWG